MTLDQLVENDSGIIIKIDDITLEEQLLSLGFIIGDEIKVERIAPLNDPILISSGLNFISIRKLNAKQIEITKKL